MEAISSLLVSKSEIYDHRTTNTTGRVSLEMGRKKERSTYPFADLHMCGAARASVSFPVRRKLEQGSEGVLERHLAVLLRPVLEDCIDG
jgi:hypothetical protein